MPEMSGSKQEELLRILEEYRTSPSQEVIDRMRARLEARRRGMPRGVSAAVLHTRMGC